MDAEDAGQGSVELACSSKATQLQLQPCCWGYGAAEASLFVSSFTSGISLSQGVGGLLDSFIFKPASTSCLLFPLLVSGERAVRAGTIMSLNMILTWTFPDLMGWNVGPREVSSISLLTSPRLTFHLWCLLSAERAWAFEEGASEYVHAVLVRLMKIQNATEIL